MTVLDYASLGIILISILIITLGIIKIHTYPGVVARERKHPQVDAIEVTSLLGLIMFPLWMGALIWAYSGALLGKMYEQQTPLDHPDSGAGKADAPDTENEADQTHADS